MKSLKGCTRQKIGHTAQVEDVKNQQANSAWCVAAFGEDKR